MLEFLRGHVMNTPRTKPNETVVGSDEKPWGSLTCDDLEDMADSVHETLRRRNEEQGEGFAYEKLTHGYWRRFIRSETLRAAGWWLFDSVCFGL